MIRQLKKKDTLWIVDFDYTLFDMYRFMDDLGVLLRRKFGVSETTYKQSKVEVQNKELYSFERHLRAIQKGTELSYQDAMRHVEALLKKSRRYFFSDALPFMREIAKKGEVVLLSHGHTLQQRRKIKASGIEKYCDRVIITSTKAKKAEWIKKLAKGRRRVVVVNDDPDETLQICAALSVGKRTVAGVNAPHVILIERPGGKYFPIPPHKDYIVVKNLKEIHSLCN